MNLPSILLWGVAATIVMTTMMSLAQGLGFTRMSIPFMVGTIVTPARDRAMVVGYAIHFVNGVLFALVYALVFESLHRTGWLLGAGLGVIHALFVLSVGMATLPGLHPHMVSEYYGPTTNRLLQPPGFFALNYGRRTPIVTLMAHAVYGGILGGLYRLVP